MHLRHAALAAALALAPAFAPTAGEAATIVYQSSGFVFFDDSDPSDIIVDFFGDATDPDVSATGRLTAGAASGGLLVSGDETLLRGDTLVSYMMGTTEAGLQSLTAVFTMLTGTEADLFGGADGVATAVFTYDLADVDDGFIDSVDVAVLSDVAPIPLPASLPLLLAGLGAVAALRRSRG